MKSRGKSTAVVENNQSRIVKAAIACFEKYGPAKTTMEDIADAAGLARKTVYRTFSNRTALLDTIAVQRTIESVGKVKPIVDSSKSLDEAIVKGTIKSCRVMRDDKLFMSIVEEANDRGVEQYLVDPSSPVLKSMLMVWKDAFTKARVRGELRKDIGDAELANWLRGVHLLLLLREDLNAKGQEALLRKFVLPALRRA